MRNITYILSLIDKAIAFEWIIDHIDSSKFNLSFIFLNSKNSHIEEFVKQKNLEYYRINFTSKKDYPKAILETRKKLKALKSDVVHSHMRDANFIGLSAARSLGIRRRIYTRHYSTYNHEYYPKAVKYDKIINSIATDIIAISEVVWNVLVNIEKVDESKISLIHHGFDLEKFYHPDKSRVKKLKNKYNTVGKYPVIGIIARYIDWKGHKYIIPALARIKEKYPEALFIFANSNGPEKKEIEDLIHTTIPNHSLEISFEKDLFSLYQLFDIYVHTPINKDIEAFGQTYIEALASGIPSVVTISGIANEFIEDQKNAIVVDHKNSDQIFEGISLLLNNRSLSEKIISNGKKDISIFDIKSFIKKLENLYD